eukprot:1143247-Pelagomonas_calceolata.AAC.11
MRVEARAHTACTAAFQLSLGHGNQHSKRLSHVSCTHSELGTQWHCHSTHELMHYNKVWGKGLWQSGKDQQRGF